MKRILTAILLLVTTSWAFALPSPKDIDAAVKAGNLPQAEAMLHEVIKEKPGSAKAHYELGQVLAREGKNADARRELLEARRIDPSLKFASDPRHVEELLNKIPAADASRATAARPVTGWQPSTTAGPPAVENSFPWGYVALGGGVLMLLWFAARRLSSAAAAPRPMASPGGALSSPGYGGGYGPGYGTPPQAPGSGMGGAVLGGLAGMAAGYGLAKVLENSGEEHRSHAVQEDSGFVPIDPVPTPDYGSFDAGSGDSDSWDGGDSFSGDDNSW